MKLTQVNDIPTSLKKLFWSDDLKKLDVRKHQDYITLQVLEYGSLMELKWLLDYYGVQKTKDIMRRYKRSLSLKKRSFIEKAVFADN